MKRKFIIVLTLFMVFIMSISLIACKDNNENNNGDLNNEEGDNDNNTDPIDDDDYTVEIYGINNQAITVTKGQIKEIGETKEVVYDWDNPCYASDKTDDNNNLIPHALKGVYLDDVLDVYADGAVSGAYSSMSITASDGYGTILTQETYSVEHGGSRMIIAYEYDDIILNPNEKSGALRAVFPDKEANSWAKKLKSIHFGDAQLSIPETQELRFIEVLGDTYNSSFERNETISDELVSFTYYGISLESLFENDILTAQETDKMYITAYDFITDGSNSFYRDYTNWKSYEYYQKAFLVYSYSQNGDEIQPYALSPKFDGENILKGMGIKNVLSLSVNKTALMSLDIAFDKFDEDNDDDIALKDILEHINMYEEQASYTVTDTLSNEFQLSKAALTSAIITKDGDDYVLRYGDSALIIKSITKN